VTSGENLPFYDVTSDAASAITLHICVKDPGRHRQHFVNIAILLNYEWKKVLGCNTFFRLSDLVYLKIEKRTELHLE
jgi:hypothetical protein